MTNKHLPIVLSVLGLAAAWYFAKKQSAQLSALLGHFPQAPAGLLPSRQIGDGYLPPIGILPSSTIGNGYVDLTSGHAPLVIDPATGDIVPSLGTDLVLQAIDPFDPTLQTLPSDPSGGTGVGPGLSMYGDY